MYTLLYKTSIINSYLKHRNTTFVDRS